MNRPPKTEAFAAVLCDLPTLLSKQPLVALTDLQYSRELIRSKSSVLKILFLTPPYHSALNSPAPYHHTHAIPETIPKLRGIETFNGKMTFSITTLPFPSSVVPSHSPSLPPPIRVRLYVASLIIVAPPTLAGLEEALGAAFGPDKYYQEHPQDWRELGGAAIHRTPFAVSYRRAPHGRVSDGRATDGLVSRKGVSYGHASHKRTPHGRALHGRTPYGLVPHRREPHGRTPHKRVPHGHVSHGRVKPGTSTNEL